MPTESVLPGLLIPDRCTLHSSTDVGSPAIHRDWNKGVFLIEDGSKPVAGWTRLAVGASCAGVSALDDGFCSVCDRGRHLLRPQQIAKIRLRRRGLDQHVSGGWITAEYSMLPYSTLTRRARDITKRLRRLKAVYVITRLSVKFGATSNLTARVCLARGA